MILKNSSSWTIFLMGLIGCITLLVPLSGKSQTSSEPDLPNCLVGDPNGNFRGNQPVTRYEFAAGLNACLHGTLDRELGDISGFATRTDFEILIQRQRELNQQIRELNQRLEGGPPPNP